MSAHHPSASELRTDPREERSASSRRRIVLAVVLALALLVIDQVIKVWVKTHMLLGESITITDWFRIYFTENPGMAFGWEIFDKLFLTFFRIIASVLLAWLVIRVAKRRYATGVLICLVAIFAGAVGNIIDSVFYGKIFTHSYGQLATAFPEPPEMAYGDWFQGKVVDMFYFPIIQTTWPEWMPIWGGEELIFFRPIFNFADACISVGVIALLIFYSSSFAHLMGSIGGDRKKPQEEAVPSSPEEDEQ